jgi:multisubunit Na+/H+ antiporter MnhB subunit
LDTLVEIAVFSMAGLGIYTLLRHASQGRAMETAPVTVAASPLIRVLAYLALPLALIIAATHILYGHDRPGDGFTGGVIVGLAIAFWYVVFGYDEIRHRLRWLRPAPLIGSGLLLVIGLGAVAAVVNGSFLAPVDFNQWLALPLPPGVKLSSGFIFEIGIFLTVLGGTAHILNTLGHPEGTSEPVEEEANEGAAPDAGALAARTASGSLPPTSGD